MFAPRVGSKHCDSYGILVCRRSRYVVTDLSTLAERACHILHLPRPCRLELWSWTRFVSAKKHLPRRADNGLLKSSLADETCAPTR